MSSALPKQFRPVGKCVKVVKDTITITFGEQAENHVGMQKIGEKAKEGFSVAELKALVERLTHDGITCELIDLQIDELKDAEEAEAAILIIRGGVDALLGKGATEKLIEEQSILEVDKKAFMKGRVVNKHARHNLCFDDKQQEPDYENGKGRIVAFKDVPVTNSIRESLPIWFGNKAKKLKAEGNYYYDLEKTYIGFHGDAERKRVIAIRLRAMMPLYYQWYLKSEPVGERFVFELFEGDIYAMSEKATGHDWKLKNTPTLRHAAGLASVLGLTDK